MRREEKRREKKSSFTGQVKRGGVTYQRQERGTSE
jgi:hypothetical protein